MRILESGVQHHDNHIGERPALALMGVGYGTEVSHLQISGTPSYGLEVRGGTVDMSHLVLSNNYDEDIRMSAGIRGIFSSW